MADNNEVLILTIKLQADSKNAKTVNELTKINKALAKTIADAPKEGAKGYKEFEKVLQSAKKQYAANTAEIVKHKKELKAGGKEIEASKTSLVGLSKTLKSLEKEYKLLSRQERKTAKGKEFQRSIAATRKELSLAEKKLGDFRRGVGNYGTIVAGLSPKLSLIAASVLSLKTGLFGLGSGFKAAGNGAKAFLIALGPISIAIGLAAAALSKFQSVIDKFKALGAGFGAAFDVIAERIGRAAISINKLFTLDFSGFAKDFAAAFSGFSAEIVKEVEGAIALTSQSQDLRRREIAQIVELANIELQIATAKRKSAEAEKKNRAVAISEINKAIALTERQRDIEVRFAEERAEILNKQVALSAETTTTDDLEKAALASASAVKLAAKFENQLRKLIGRRETLAAMRDKKEINALQALQKEQAALTLIIKNQLLAREDASDSILEFAKVTEELLRVEKLFKELTGGLDKEVQLTVNSIAAYNKELTDLNTKLESVNVSSEEYATIQTQILQLEAQRDASVGSLTESINELNIAQAETLKVLEDSETELRIRAAAQAQIEAIVGDSEEAAARRVEIEDKLNSDIDDIRVNRINDEKAALKEELATIDENLKKELQLFSGNELKKQEILLIAQGKRDEIKQRALDFEAELLKIGIDKFDQAEKDKTKSAKNEEANRKKLRDLAIDTSIEAANKIVELISVIQAQETEKQEVEINKREEAAIQEAERLGKTETEKQKIRDKFNAEREALERKAAAERKAIAIAEAVIDIAGAVIKSLNTAPPVNVAFAAATAALGAIQLAIISATNFADGGLVKPVELQNGRIVNTPNINQMSNGDNILATVRTNEVILNESQQRALGGAATFRSIGVPGFGSGGRTDFKSINESLPFSSGLRVTAFKSNPAKIRAFAGGGAVSSLFASSVDGAISDQSAEFLAAIAKAVQIGAAIGSKQGTENADITGQIAKQNQRDARRTTAESV